MMLAGAALFVTAHTQSWVPVSLAKGDDNGDDGDDDGGDDGDSKDDKEKESEKKKSEADKKAKEEAKKKAERESEAAKKSAEQMRKSSGSGNEAENESDDINDDHGIEVEDEDENESGDDNGMFKDRTKTLSKLDEELAKAEKEILEKQAEGVDVTAALARLAEAKAKAGTVGAAFDANDLAAVKDLGQEVKKLAHFASHDDLHDAKKVAENVARVAKRIAQTTGKISLLEAVGGDGSAFKASLATLETEYAGLKETVTAGSYDVVAMEASLRTLERKVKAVKSSVEAAIYALGGTDSKYDDDYEDESHDVAEHLNDVAEIEDDHVGLVIHGIAEDHKSSAKKVGEVVTKIDNRNPVLQTLLGSSSSDLNELEQEIAANKSRVEMLTQAANSVSDPDVQTMLFDQIETLKEQTAKLETFVEGQRDRLSVLGWFFKLF